MGDACVARGAANARATGMARATRRVEAPRCEVLSANHFLGLDTRARGARRSLSVSFTGLLVSFTTRISIVVTLKKHCIDSLIHSCFLLLTSSLSSSKKLLPGGRKARKRKKEKKIRKKKKELLFR
jgi:hypothetical protein